MVEFKVVLSDPKNGQSHKVDAVAARQHSSWANMSVTKWMPHRSALPGTGSKITGASDRNGYTGKAKPPVCRKEKTSAVRRGRIPPCHGWRTPRKPVRGNEITADFVQINAKVTTSGDKALEEIFPKAAPAEKAV